ncbi:unnamed protein product [Linum trigynum]|uniref:Uncharacterized protein n=1 Tax=Linum trigynum TaxID=586398 RepID=A0AAV2GNR8_9ROSI
MNGRTTPWRKKQKQNQTRNSYCEGWIPSPTLIGTSPSSNWPPMVLKINLGHLGTLARHFLSLGIVLSLKNSNPLDLWLKICLKASVAKARSRARPCNASARPCFG